MSNKWLLRTTFPTETAGKQQDQKFAEFQQQLFAGNTTQKKKFEVVLSKIEYEVNKIFPDGSQDKNDVLDSLQRFSRKGTESIALGVIDPLAVILYGLVDPEVDLEIKKQTLIALVSPLSACTTGAAGEIYNRSLGMRPESMLQKIVALANSAITRGFYELGGDENRVHMKNQFFIGAFNLGFTVLPKPPKEVYGTTEDEKKIKNIIKKHYNIEALVETLLSESQTNLIAVKDTNFLMTLQPQAPCNAKALALFKFCDLAPEDLYNLYLVDGLNDYGGLAALCDAIALSDVDKMKVIPTNQECTLSMLDVDTMALQYNSANNSYNIYRNVDQKLEEYSINGPEELIQKLNAEYPMWSNNPTTDAMSFADVLYSEFTQNKFLDNVHLNKDFIVFKIIKTLVANKMLLQSEDKDADVLSMSVDGDSFLVKSNQLEEPRFFRFASDKNAVSDLYFVDNVVRYKYDASFDLIKQYLQKNGLPEVFMHSDKLYFYNKDSGAIVDLVTVSGSVERVKIYREMYKKLGVKRMFAVLNKLKTVSTKLPNDEIKVILAGLLQEEKDIYHKKILLREIVKDSELFDNLKPLDSVENIWCLISDRGYYSLDKQSVLPFLIKKNTKFYTCLEYGLQVKDKRATDIVNWLLKNNDLFNSKEMILKIYSQYPNLSRVVSKKFASAESLYILEYLVEKSKEEDVLLDSINLMNSKGKWVKLCILPACVLFVYTLAAFIIIYPPLALFFFAGGGVALTLGLLVFSFIACFFIVPPIGSRIFNSIPPYLDSKNFHEMRDKIITRIATSQHTYQVLADGKTVLMSSGARQINLNKLSVTDVRLVIGKLVDTLNLKLFNELVVNTNIKRNPDSIIKSLENLIFFTGHALTKSKNFDKKLYTAAFTTIIKALPNTPQRAATLIYLHNQLELNPKALALFKSISEQQGFNLLEGAHKLHATQKLQQTTVKPQILLLEDAKAPAKLMFTKGGVKQPAEKQKNTAKSLKRNTNVNNINKENKETNSKLKKNPAKDNDRDKPKR